MDTALLLAAGFFGGCVIGYLHGMPETALRRSARLRVMIKIQARKIRELRRRLDGT